MRARAICVGLAMVSLLLCAAAATAQEKPKNEPKKSGTIIGELKSKKDTKDGKNTIIDVLAPGEEKARSYFVNYDPKIKGPFPKVLEAVRAAKLGDKVELKWVGTNHGPAIEAFEVIKKAGESPKDPPK